MKKTLLSTLAFAGLTTVSQALSPAFTLGGGYMEDPGEGYAFLQLKGAFYEDDAFRHSVFLEVLGHSDNAILEFPGRGGGLILENGSIDFLNFTANYEVEAKLNSALSLYFGAGLGFEYVSLDDRFDFSLDSDTNFIGQTFFGLRGRIGENAHLQAGVRRLWREDFSLLDDQFLTEDTWAYELGIGFQF